MTKLGQRVVRDEMAHIFHNGAAWEERSRPTDNERHGGCGGAILWHWMVEPDVIATCVVLHHGVDVGPGEGEGEEEGSYKKVPIAKDNNFHLIV